MNATVVGEYIGATLAFALFLLGLFLAVWIPYQVWSLASRLLRRARPPEAEPTQIIVPATTSAPPRRAVRGGAASGLVRIYYQDGRGEETVRDVQVSGIDVKDYGPVFTGWCTLRNASRTFRFDRVTTALDPSTGEVIPDLWSHLGGMGPMPAYTGEPLRASGLELPPSALEQVADVIRMLVYVCKADGQMRAPERAIVVATCNELLGGGNRVRDADILRAPERFGLVTYEEFGRLADNLGHSDLNRLIRVIKAAEHIIKTQKTVHADEERALRRLRAATGSLTM